MSDDPRAAWAAICADPDPAAAVFREVLAAMARFLRGDLDRAGLDDAILAIHGRWLDDLRREAPSAGP